MCGREVLAKDKGMGAAGAAGAAREGAKTEIRTRQVQCEINLTNEVNSNQTGSWVRGPRRSLEVLSGAEVGV